MAVVGLSACHDANQVEPIRDVPAAPPRVFHWQLVPETAEMADGAFATDAEGWVIGPYGTIMHTGDRGASWQAVASGTTAQLDRISAIATPAGPFGLITGTGIALRFGGVRWSSIDGVAPAAGKRPNVHLGADGKIEAWIATTDGFAYATDAATGGFAKAAVPAGATAVVVSDTGDSWTLVPSSDDCVPHRRRHGEVDWHPMPTNRTAPARAALGIRPFEPFVHSLTQPRARGCADTELTVTLSRKRLWLIVSDGVSEWDDARQAWTNYSYPADLATSIVGLDPAARVAVVLGATATAIATPPGGVSDLLDDDADVVVFPQHTPPTVYPRRQAMELAPAAHKDLHERALALWDQARTTKFAATDLWMRGAEVWAAGSGSIARSRDGGQTWTVAPIADLIAGMAATQDLAPQAIRRSRPTGTSLRKLAFDARAASGWAIADDGQRYRYDGAWHAADRIANLSRALALTVADDGHAAWLLTRDALYQFGPATAAAPAPAAIVFRDEPATLQALAVCPDGKTGWARYGDYHWLGFDGTAWQPRADRPALTCLAEPCAAAIDAAAPRITGGATGNAASSNVVCAAGGQIWSLAQGQTADGATWRHAIAGLESMQGRLAALWADNAAAPGAMIAVRPDGTLLRSDGHTDQHVVSDPQATADGNQVVLSWTLPGAASEPVTWTVEHCVVSGEACKLDTQWLPDSGLQQQVDRGRYTTSIDPAKLSLVAGTRVDYRIRVAEGDLRRAPLRIAEVTLGESLAQAVLRISLPYLEGLAAWLAVLLVLLAVWPRQLLRLNDAARRVLAQLPLLGGVASELAGFVLARKLIRTPRVVGAWLRDELRPAAADEPVEDRPEGFASLADPATRALYAALPATQHAWIALHRARAEQTFERSQLAKERVAYGEAPARCDGEPLAKGVGLETMRERIAPAAGDPKLVVWIRGPGGVGKSHLACRIARWVFKQALVAQPAIAIVLDDNAESVDALKAAIRGKLAQVTQATDVDDVLATALLTAGAVVPIFDGVTERSAKTQAAIQAFLEDPAAPALAICTARAEHALTARRAITLEPLALDADELLPFLSSFRASLPADQRRTEDLIEPVRRAARQIAEAGRRTRLTPLLVTLVWNEAVADASFSELAVEAFSNYVARALVAAGPDAGEQRRLALLRARALGRLALGKDYRPGRWFTRDQAAEQLRATSGSVDAFLTAGLLETRADGGELRFLLDPLSEYLAALAILHNHDGNDATWQAFVVELDQLPAEARLAADGFLRALADCFVAHGTTLQLTRAPRVDDL